MDLPRPEPSEGERGQLGLDRIKRARLRYLLAAPTLLVAGLVAAIAYGLGRNPAAVVAGMAAAIAFAALSGWFAHEIGLPRRAVAVLVVLALAAVLSGLFGAAILVILIVLANRAKQRAQAELLSADASASTGRVRVPVVAIGIRAVAICVALIVGSVAVRGILRSLRSPDPNAMTSTVIPTVPVSAQTVRVGAEDIRLTTAGSGPPVVILDLYKRQRDIAPLIELAAGKYQLIAIDHLSEFGDKRNSSLDFLAERAQLAHDVLQSMGIRRPIIVGVDSSAIAPYYAGLFPDDEAGLVTVGLKLHPGGELEGQLPKIVVPTVVIINHNYADGERFAALIPHAISRYEAQTFPGTWEDAGAKLEAIDFVANPGAGHREAS